MDRHRARRGASRTSPSHRPPHGTGKRQGDADVARVRRCRGIAVEVHHKPQEALSDGPQALTPAMFAELMAEVGPIARAMGRTI
jgi:3-deoxy-7-phosphoheptulonate synthase